MPSQEEPNALSLLLQKHSFHFHDLDSLSFRAWLEKEIRRRQNDLVFLARCEIRNTQKLYRPTLSELQKEYDATSQVWENSPEKSHWEEITQRIENRKKAVEGLQQAVAERREEKREARLKKLQDYRQELAFLEGEQKALSSRLPERDAFLVAQDKLCVFQREIGLTEKKAQLEKLLHDQAQQTTTTGAQFEEHAYALIQDKILADLGESAGNRKILSQVTLGCARAEIDYLVIEENPADSFVRVLAMVEVKRNINDLAHGFRMRQENLAWLTGDIGSYDPESYRTNFFREGHFDRPACHEEKGQKFCFTKESFSLFQRCPKTQFFLERLYFITDVRPLLGMLTSEYAQILYRISTDIDFNLESTEYLEKLLLWAKSMVEPLQTQDVLALYAPERKSQILFLARHKDREYTLPTE